VESFRFVSRLMVVGFLALTFSSLASAQATRTWVSGVGDDANPCSRTAPCKTFAGAISKTAPAGEINCLDPGGFGSVTITKSISIICEIGTAGVLVSGTNGIVIAAGTSDIVFLKGLDFEGLNTGLSGVNILTASSVTIDKCLIRGFATAGVAVVNSSSGVSVNVTDSVIADNTGEGILVKPSGSVGARVNIFNTTVSHSGGDGIFLNANLTSGGVKMSIRGSKSVDNGADGYGVFSGGSVAQMMIDSSDAFDNITGIAATGSGAIVRFTRCTISANSTGVRQSFPGSALSYGTNSIDGNGSNGSFGTTTQQ